MSSQLPESVLDAFLERYLAVGNIACQVVTYGNVVLTRYLTPTRARSIASGQSSLRVLNPVNRFYESSGISFPQQELMALEDDTWVPDWTTLRPSPDPVQATVQCNVVEPGGHQGEKSPRDPRWALACVAKAAEEAGIEVKVGIEVEFAFTDEEGKVIPVPGSPLALFASNATRSPLRKIVFEAVKHLELSGVGIWGYHPEGSGWEIALSPAPPLQAVDYLVFLHDTLKELAYQNGLRASFYPLDGTGHTIGQHIHISINGSRVTPGSADSWLAGMLKHLPAATAFLNGGIDSYDPERRFWCGSGSASWSKAKFGAIRRPSYNHWEIRLGDCLTTPYSQLAVMIHAGLDGLRRQIPLEIRSLDVKGFIEVVPQDVLDKAGVKEMLPTTLEQALAVLEKDLSLDGGLTSLVGKELVGAHLIAKRYELEQQSKLDPQARRKAVIQNI